MVRLTGPAHAPRARPIYRTEHFRPLAPNPPTSPTAEPRDLGRSRAAPRDLGRSRAYLGAPRATPRDLGRSPPTSGHLGAAPRYLGRSRSVARAASHLLKKKEGPGWSHEVTPHPERRASLGFLAASPSSPDGCCRVRRQPRRTARPSPRHGTTPCAHPAHLPHERPQRRNYSCAHASLGPRERRPVLPFPPPAPQSPP